MWFCQSICVHATAENVHRSTVWSQTMYMHPRECYTYLTSLIWNASMNGVPQPLQIHYNMCGSMGVTDDFVIAV